MKWKKFDEQMQRRKILNEKKSAEADDNDSVSERLDWIFTGPRHITLHSHFQVICDMNLMACNLYFSITRAREEMMQDDDINRATYEGQRAPGGGAAECTEKLLGITESDDDVYICNLDNLFLRILIRMHARIYVWFLKIAYPWSRVRITLDRQLRYLIIV